MKYKYLRLCQWHSEKTKTDHIWGILQIGFDYDNWEKEYTERKLMGIGPLLQNYLNQQDTENKYVTFWGIKGKKLQKRVWSGYPYHVEHKFYDKVGRHWTVGKYTEYTPFSKKRKNLKSIYPTFQQDLDKIALWAMLSS
jgi:hypothetical protein